jgi:hypothetical protein
MKNFLQRYLLMAAAKPFRTAAWAVVVPAIVLFLTSVYMLGGEFNQAIMIMAALVFLVLSLINLIVPLFFATYFYKFKNRIVLIRPGGKPASSMIYQRPLWGNIPHVEITFPDDWDLTDNSAQRTLELVIIFRANSTMIASLSMEVVLSFCGDFQADNLEELIRQQGNDANDKRFNFRSCLQKIVNRFLYDRRELIKDDLILWQQQSLSTKEFEKKWLRPEIIFSALFDNIEKIELHLREPEIIYTKNRKR